MDANAKDSLMTKKEIADMARVDVRTVQRWVSGGLLKPALRKGHTLRFRRGDVLLAAERYLYGGGIAQHDPAMG